MQLPKYKKKKRIKLKICQYCGKEFWGHPIAKYCELHRDVKQREKTKKSPEPGDSNNKTYNHDFIEVAEETWTCELEGCDQTYTVKVFPKQFVYPRFCGEHRNEFKRRNWVRAKLVEELRKNRAAAVQAVRDAEAEKPKAARVPAKPKAVKAVKAAKPEAEGTEVAAKPAAKPKAKSTPKKA
ncbi:MAG: hypothetical protein H6686_12425 [Fibrobacteria bacterium]|nr:hypothetical protein [Fibrobacteria bacterium]